jgi:probable selenium-dependent hydroxylase accessory protein YqeC
VRRGLFELFGLEGGGVVAVAGAGGKTTLIHTLADQACAAGLRVLITTTTHMGTAPPEVTGPVFVDSEGATDQALGAALSRPGRATVLGRRLREDKLDGVTPDRVDALAAHADLVLVEADGARARSLKVPAPHEPVVPSSTRLLIVVAALDALGAPLDEAHVHRLPLVEQATGAAAGDTVGEGTVVRALAAPTGYPAHAPVPGESAVFFNKAEDAARRQAAAHMAAALVPPYDFVVAGSARAGVGERWP